MSEFTFAFLAFARAVYDGVGWRPSDCIIAYSALCTRAADGCDRLHAPAEFAYRRQRPRHRVRQSDQQRPRFAKATTVADCRRLTYKALTTKAKA